MKTSTRYALVAAIGAVTLIGIGVALKKGSSDSAPTPALAMPIECPQKLTRESLQESLQLGKAFMLKNQKPEGNFAYEYDWRTKEYTPGDNEVRQAGAAWGLSLLYRDSKDVSLVEPLERSLDFFNAHSKLNANSGRYVVYPESERTGLGTVALIALAHIEYLATEGTLSPEKKAEYQKYLEEYLTYIRQSIRPDGLFAGRYTEDGVPTGSPSPYSDGEALLALAKAVRYMGYEEWVPQIQKLADQGYALNVTKALAENPDSDTTKGYYQWSSMAYFELIEGGWDPEGKYGKNLLTLADWMIDTHQVLERPRNTAYAFEGIGSALAYAKKIGDDAHVERFSCATHNGLSRLLTLQVGSTLSNDFITRAFDNDPVAIGGIQNHKSESLLRIDVVQHQMHATMLALRYLPLE